MSSAKQYNLPPFEFIPTQNIDDDFVSQVTNIYMKDNIGIQLVWDGDLEGTFAAQISADYDHVTRAGNWTSITLSPVPAAFGSPDNAYIDITQISAPYIRVAFTHTNGSGNLTGTITAKGV